MSDVSSPQGAWREWFAALRRAHTIAALGIFGVVSILLPLIGQPTIVQFSLALSLALFVSLPHASLDQYSAFIVMQPRLGKYWPLGFLLFYSLVAVSVALLWMFAPAMAALLLLALSALHFGLGDVEDSSPFRWLEIITRSCAPLALAVLFNASALSAFFGWLILDVRVATVAIYDYAVPAAIAWQVAWAVIVVRHLWNALASSNPNSAVVVAEMSMLVLAFAVLPPLVAFVLYASLLHAPRHIIDFAERNPHGGAPSKALWRVLRGAAIPTAMTVAGLAIGIFYASGSDLSPSHIARLAIWVLTAFSAPHMILTFVAMRPFTGLRRVPVDRRNAAADPRLDA